MHSAYVLVEREALMNMRTFGLLNRVPQAECEGSLTDMKSSAIGEDKESTNTRGAFLFVCPDAKVYLLTGILGFHL